MADKPSTRDQVAELLDAGKDAKEIAEAIGKTPATVYVHIRNIKESRGEKVQSKRGRPPKVKTEDGQEKPKTATRPAPGAKAKPAESKASTNGHDAVRFPKIKEAIEAELAEAKSRVVVLEKMAESLA